jgi:hypothetical protein
MSNDGTQSERDMLINLIYLEILTLSSDVHDLAFVSLVPGPVRTANSQCEM